MNRLHLKRTHSTYQTRLIWLSATNYVICSLLLRDFSETVYKSTIQIYNYVKNMIVLSPDGDGGSTNVNANGFNDNTMNARYVPVNIDLVLFPNANESAIQFTELHLPSYTAHYLSI